MKKIGPLQDVVISLNKELARLKSSFFHSIDYNIKKFRHKYLYSFSFKIKQQGRGCSMIHDGPVYDRP